MKLIYPLAVFLLNQSHKIDSSFDLVLIFCQEKLWSEKISKKLKLVIKF